MKFILFNLIGLIATTANADGYKSKMTISAKELNQYAIIHGTEGNEYLATASRLIHLELNAAKCSPVVLPEKFEADGSKEYTFTISSDTCQVMAKAGPACPSGFAARNIPESHIGEASFGQAYKVGTDSYKLCIKETSGDTGSKNSHVRTN